MVVGSCGTNIYETFTKIMDRKMKVQMDFLVREYLVRSKSLEPEVLRKLFNAPDLSEDSLKLEEVTQHFQATSTRKVLYLDSENDIASSLESEEEGDNMKRRILYVANLDYNLRKEDLRDFAAQYGCVDKLTIKKIVQKGICFFTL